MKGFSLFNVSSASEGHLLHGIWLHDSELCYRCSLFSDNIFLAMPPQKSVTTRNPREVGNYLGMISHLSQTRI